MTWLDRLLEEGSRESQPKDAEASDSNLEALCAGLPPEDAQGLREERAAILEYEAGMSREEAEHRAGLKPKRVEAA
jgi:hypothetical protein